MQVLLWEDVVKLGKRGAVVDVSDGFARNYLLPRKIASVATPAMHKELEKAKVRLEEKEKKVALTFKELAEQIEKTSITMEVNTNEEGKLYGSVTPTMIADAFKENNVTVDAKLIDIQSPIKDVGVYEVKIKLFKDIEAVAKVWVVASKESKQE